MKTQKTYLPLDEEVRAGVETACAAFHLGRRPQTLRAWACTEAGPIKPRRIAGILMWPTAELRALCGVANGPAPLTVPMRQPTPAAPPDPPRRGRPRKATLAAVTP